MSFPNRSATKRPLMRVNEQQPRRSSTQASSAKHMCMRLPNFIVSGIGPPASTSSDGDSCVPNNGTFHGNPCGSTYRQVVFTGTNGRNVNRSSNTSDQSKEPKQKKRRTTKLTKSGPSKPSPDMHADAWNIILAHTRPSFIMQMRRLSKFFYHLTNADAIWRQSREQQFGPDVPPCPSFISERQYADLLDGRGCQHASCERRETRKTRWIFRVRFCDECLAQKTGTFKFGDVASPQSLYASMFDDIADREQFGTNIIDLLPTSSLRSGKVKSPRTVSREGARWAYSLSAVAPVSYLKSDYMRLEREYEQMVLEEWEPQKVFAWTRAKYLEAVHIAKTASEMEDWWFKTQYDNTTNNSAGDLVSIREARREFYIEKAEQAVPPIPPEVLECFSAFQNALASPNPPTERTWQILRAKILPYQELAEQVVRYPATNYPWSTPSDASAPELVWFDDLHEHRTKNRKLSGNWQPEQQFVLGLAQDEFARLDNRVADEDLLLLCLRNVYQAFQRAPNKPRGLIYDGTEGEYRLSLDDAKMVVEEVIESRIPKSTLRGTKVLESLKCMGCTRWASGKKYTFQSAFEHMLEKHSKTVGKDLYFYRFLKHFKVPGEYYRRGCVFPWYLIEWTKSLPLLPVHGTITANTKWLPDADVPYTEFQEPHAESVFGAKSAIAHPSTARDDFEGNFIHALKLLLATRLEIDVVVALATRYSTQLYGSKQGGRPAIEVFLACIKTSKQVNGGLQFKFRCGACSQRPNVSSHIRCVKHAVDVETLYKHWCEKHRHENMDWVMTFADLPSDTALSKSMVDHDEKLRADQEQSIRRETIDVKKNTRKLPDQKAAVLMQRHLAMDVFGQLFA